MPEPTSADEPLVPTAIEIEPEPEASVSTTYDTAVTLPVEVIDTFTPSAPVPTPPVDLRPIQEAITGLESRISGLPIGELARKVDALQASFDREIRAEATREKVVDRLHAELQEYKNDLLMKVMRPIVLDLIQLHDDMGKRIEVDPESEVARELDQYRQGIEDALYRQGIEPYRVEDDTFDPRRQRALKTEATDLPERNKRVAGRIRPGFKSGDKIIRLELVAVYTHKP